MAAVRCCVRSVWGFLWFCMVVVRFGDWKLADGFVVLCWRWVRYWFVVVPICWFFRNICCCVSNDFVSGVRSAVIFPCFAVYQMAREARLFSSWLHVLFVTFFSGWSWLVDGVFIWPLNFDIPFHSVSSTWCCLQTAGHVALLVVLNQAGCCLLVCVGGQVVYG